MSSRIGMGALAGTGAGAGVPAEEGAVETSPIGVSPSASPESDLAPSPPLAFAGGSIARCLPFDKYAGGWGFAATSSSRLMLLGVAFGAAGCFAGSLAAAAAAAFSAAASSSRFRFLSASFALPVSRGGFARSRATRSARMVRFVWHVCARSTAIFRDRSRLARILGSSVGMTGPLPFATEAMGESNAGKGGSWNARRSRGRLDGPAGG